MEIHTQMSGELRITRRRAGRPFNPAKMRRLDWKLEYTAHIDDTREEQQAC
jgi:hypothetical protein